MDFGSAPSPAPCATQELWLLRPGRIRGAVKPQPSRGPWEREEQQWARCITKVQAGAGGRLGEAVQVTGESPGTVPPGHHLPQTRH